IQKLVQSGLRTSTVIELDVDNQPNRVIVKEVQRHPVNGEILHVDFYRLTPGRRLTVNIPVTTKGNAIGVKDGGALEQFYNSVKIRTTPEALKETIEVDVTNLGVGDGVRLSALPVSKEWDIRLEGDPMILKVSRSRMTLETDAAPGAEGAPAAAAAAAPAAGAKAPEKK
ncbi:MAG TPA: 50S ribosomal protein L25, partial [Leptospiraceae bacterium]|nr:50S ribosomal protein L25 [Leptospiraceae bacterium]